MQILLNKQCECGQGNDHSKSGDDFLFLSKITNFFLFCYRFNTDKADKLAEIEKTERQVQQQQEREDEMRELALRLRRRYGVIDQQKEIPQILKRNNFSPMFTGNENFVIDTAHRRAVAANRLIATATMKRRMLNRKMCPGMVAVLH